MKALIEEAWNNRELLKEAKYQEAVRQVIEELDKGQIEGGESFGETDGSSMNG